MYDQGKNRISKPSFTLPSYGGAVIDYVAADQQLLQTEQLYRYNQIPAVVVGPPDLYKPNRGKDLYEKLERLTHHAFDPMRCMSQPAGK